LYAGNFVAAFLENLQTNVCQVQLQDSIFSLTRNHSDKNETYQLTPDSFNFQKDDLPLETARLFSE